MGRRPSPRPAGSRVGRRRTRGQGLVEFTLILPVFVLLLMGMLEFGLMFDHNITLGYASREGARVGAALANGGGTLGCGNNQSPNAGIVDPAIIAAVQRVLTSPGSLIDVSRIGQIRIYKADSAGRQVGSNVNVWTYSKGGGPAIDGKALDFRLAGTEGWRACSRTNATSPDSIGIGLTYTYQLSSGLGSVMRFFGGAGLGTLQMADDTVMALNPTNQ